MNLTPDNLKEFTLPTMEVPVEFSTIDGDRTEMQTVIDTILFEPDLNRFMLIWRTSYPLKKDIFEIAQVVVGKMSRAWYRAQELGKTHYSSLDDLVREKTTERKEAAEASEDEESDDVDETDFDDEDALENAEEEEHADT